VFVIIRERERERERGRITSQFFAIHALTHRPKYRKIQSEGRSPQREIEGGRERERQQAKNQEACEFFWAPLQLVLETFKPLAHAALHDGPKVHSRVLRYLFHCRTQLLRPHGQTRRPAENAELERGRHA